MENHRLLRHKPTGILYAYQDVFAVRPDFEEVVPEPAEVVEPVKAPRTRRVAEAPDDKAVAAAIAEAIGVDASRNLP